MKKEFRRETDFQDKIMDKLPEWFSENVWCFKANDLVRFGLPDLFICFYGLFVVIELKNGKTPPRKHEKLQRHNIELIKKAKGHGFVARSMAEVYDGLMLIKKNFNL